MDRRDHALTRRRVAALVALAVVPLAVLGIFFALPVAGMVARGVIEESSPLRPCPVGWNRAGSSSTDQFSRM